MKKYFSIYWLLACIFFVIIFGLVHAKKHRTQNRQVASQEVPEVIQVSQPEMANELRVALTNQSEILISGPFKKSDPIDLLFEAGPGDLKDYPGLRVNTVFAALSDEKFILPNSLIGKVKGRLHYRIVWQNKLKTGQLISTDFKEVDILKNRKKFSYSYQEEKEKLHRELGRLQRGDMKRVENSAEIKCLKLKKCELAFIDQWLELSQLLKSENQPKGGKQKSLETLKNKIDKINSVNF